MLVCCQASIYDQGESVEVEQGGFTPLLFAARVGDLAAARLLIGAGANVNDTTPVGTTALVVAAHSGHGALSLYLMDKSADPNAAGAGYTALHAAVLQGDLNLTKALLAHGARPDTPLIRGTPTRRHSQHLNFDRSWIGATPFWLAARFAEVDIMRTLADGKADPRLATRDGTTPLIVGAKGESRRTLGRITVERSERERRALDAVKLVVAVGGDVNAANQAGDTALHRAASRGIDAVIQFLADVGATLEVKNNKGQTPLMLAMSARHNSTSDLLRKLDAKE